MPKWKVYKVTTEDGEYIGMTGRPLNIRLSELKYTRGFIGTIELVKDFETREEALAYERELRPNYHMGLNISVGGFKAGGNLPKHGAQNGMALRVKVDGVEYPTAKAAGDAHGLKKTTVNYRLQSLYYPNWEYLDKPYGSYWNNKQSKSPRKPGISIAKQSRAA